MKNKDKIILDLCGGTGSWSKPYADAGYDVRVITLPEYDVRDTYYSPMFKNSILFKGRLNTPDMVVKIDAVHGILAAPPCTEFSIARNHKLVRHFNEALMIVNSCLRIIEVCKPKFWALENPSGHLARFIGKPAFSFQPWEFGDGWSKRTMLWGKFNEPIKKHSRWEDVPKIRGLYIRPGRKTASLAFQHLSHKKFIRAMDLFNADSDAVFRAITSPAFAKAFFKSNP